MKIYKLFSAIIIAIITTFSGFSQQSNNYAQVESALLNLYFAADAEDYSKANSALKTSAKLWEATLSLKSDDQVCNILRQTHTCAIDGYFSVLRIALDSKNFDLVQLYSSKIITELSKSRSVESSQIYPLDIAWNAYQSYLSVHETVHDQMFGLREWFEFEDMVHTLSADLQYYNNFKLTDIQTYFPHIDAKAHNEALVAVNSCFYEFLLSLESGYTEEFEWPCYELGEALVKLLELYKNS